MVPLARRNLLAEKARLAMSIAGVAFAVLLILVVVSLYRGWSGASGLFSELPGDLWVTQTGTSDPFRSMSLLPADRLRDLERIAGVQVAMPVYSRRIALPNDGRDLNVFFMSLAAPAALPLPEKARQRVSIARALANRPPLLLADEPTANLDSRHGREVMELLRDLTKRERNAAVVVSHDLRLRDIADRVLWLEDGRLREFDESAVEREPVPAPSSKAEATEGPQRAAAGQEPLKGQGAFACSASSRTPAVSSCSAIRR